MQIKNTPETVSFLRANLCKFLTFHKKTGEWNKSRIADWITTSDKISGSINDTTIGRFLKPDQKQRPSISTLRMIAGFLIQKKVITDNQIQFAETSSQITLSANLKEFFGISNENMDFYDSISGSYQTHNEYDDFVLEGLFNIIYESEYQDFYFSENLFLFKNSKFVNRSLTSNIYQTRLTGTGVLKKNGICIILLKDSQRNFENVINIERFTTEKNSENIISFQGKRNHTCTVKQSGDLTSAAYLIQENDPLKIIKFLSLCFFYEKIDKNIKSNYLTPMTRASNNQSDIKNFVMDTKLSFPSSLKETVRECFSEDNNSSEIGLILNALETRDFATFKEIFQNGADPNILDPEYNRPLIFSLLHQRQFHWVEYLISNTQINLLVKDRNGMFPSYYPTLWAEELNGWKNYGKECKAFAMFLIETETLQMHERGLNPEELSFF